MRRDLEMEAARTGTVPGGLHGKPGALSVFPGLQHAASSMWNGRKLGSSWRERRESSAQSWKFLRKVVTTLEHVKEAPEPSHTSLVNKTIRERKRDEKPNLFFNVVRKSQGGDEQPQV